LTRELNQQKIENLFVRPELKLKSKCLQENKQGISCAKESRKHVKSASVQRAVIHHLNLPLLMFWGMDH